MSDLERQIKQQIITAIDQDKLVLPTLPEVALKVRSVAEDPESTIAHIVAVLGNDAAITARIIKVCNSPLLRGSREISNLNMAVSRLGMQYTANLATALAMEQMFQATTEMIDVRMREIWRTSTEIAGICHVLANHFTKLKPDQATLAGLIHKIGALPILTFIEEHEIRINAVQLDNLIDNLHPPIGGYILRKWDFAPELRMVPKEHSNYTRKVPTADYADLVMVAKLQSTMGTDQMDTSLDWTTVTAFERLGLDPQVDMGESEDLSAEMAAAMALLNS
ncbi:MAG: histidine kinase [unclassified Hahellaceae]|nr:histidine kinase [Hahellaceae bacterium]|tara:strand:- start:10912 stop:11748 length:837 start_codon:yes stop_codon:yes gene_type:complete